MRNRQGYSLLELLAVLSVVSVLGMLMLPQLSAPFLEPYHFAYAFIDAQSLAMLENRQINLNFSSENLYLNSGIHFNAKGHVNQAQTVTFYKEGRWHEWIVELGGGRLVER